MRCAVRRGLVGLSVVLSASASAAWGDFTVSTFDNTGFDWMHSGWSQTVGPDFVSVSDPADGWGGGILDYQGDPFDFSALASGHFRIDAMINPGNDALEFNLALRDVNDNQGKWRLNLDALGTGTWHTLTASTNLGTPQFGNGDWQNLDLTQIKNLELQGQWTGASSFDVSFDNLIVQTDGFIERYPGHAPDAPWRAEAEQRIDQVRKAHMHLVVQDVHGNALDGAEVQVRMTNHAFGFGTALDLFRLTSDTASNVTYRQKFLEAFNSAGSHNDLKWPPLEGDWGATFSEAKALAGLDWLADHDIPARGHVMVWPGYGNLPNFMKAKLDEYNDTGTSDARRLELADEMRQAVLDHIAEIGSATEGKLYAWDVINEPRANHDLMDILGDDVMADWFAAARAANPSARLFINEYNIVTSGGTHADARDLYYDQIQALIDAGVPIGGIGVQGHFSDGSLTGPEQVWSILDRFGEFGLPIQVTEFDYGTTDVELQRDYFRDFLIAAFAHEDVSDIIQWGFWAGAHWRPDAAIYGEDWTLRPHGEEFLRLLFDEWRTEEDLSTDLLGEAELRGFLGAYEITVLHDGRLQTFNVMLDEGGGTYTLVLVPEPSTLGAVALGSLLLLRRRRRTA